MKGFNTTASMGTSLPWIIFFEEEPPHGLYQKLVRLMLNLVIKNTVTFRGGIRALVYVIFVRESPMEWPMSTRVHLYENRTGGPPRRSICSRLRLVASTRLTTVTENSIVLDQSRWAIGHYDRYFAYCISGVVVSDLNNGPTLPNAL